MIVNTEIHTNDHVRDEGAGPGECTMNANIYVEFLGIMPSQKKQARDIVERFYKELCSELKNIS